MSVSTFSEIYPSTDTSLYPYAEPGHRRLCRGSDLAVTNIEMLTVIEQNELPKSAQKSFLLTPGLPDAFAYLSKK